MSENTKVDNAIEWFFNAIQKEDRTLTRVLRDFYSNGWLAGHGSGYSEGLEDAGASSMDRMKLEDGLLEERRVRHEPNLFDLNDTVEFLKYTFGEQHEEGLDHVAEILYETASMVHTHPEAFDFSDDLPSDMEMKFGGLTEETSVDGHQYIKIVFYIRYITGEVEWVNYTLFGKVPSHPTKGIEWELF